MVGRGVVHKVISLAPQLLFFIHPDLLTVVEVIQPFNFSVSPWFRLIRCNGDVDAVSIPRIRVSYPGTDRQR